MSIEHLHSTQIVAPRPATAALRRKLWICLALAGLLLAPLIGGLLKWRGLPPDFGHFPPAQGQADPELAAERVRGRTGCDDLGGVNLFNAHATHP